MSAHGRPKIGEGVMSMFWRLATEARACEATDDMLLDGRGWLEMLPGQSRLEGALAVSAARHRSEASALRHVRLSDGVHWFGRRRAYSRLGSGRVP
jgi:hypothetical protein